MSTHSPQKPPRGALSPASHSHFQSVLTLLREGDLRQALAACDQLLIDHPGDINLLGLKGVALGDLGETAAARAVLLEVIEREPQFAKPYEDLGTLLLDAGQAAEALPLLQRAVDLDPSLVAAHYHWARALAYLADHEQAVSAYRRCIELSPSHSAAWLGLGRELNTLGRRDECVAAYRRCLQLDPLAGEAYYKLAKLKNFRFTDADIESMQRALQQDELAAGSRVNLLFALGKAFENRHRYARAWRYFAEGNAAQRRLTSYDPVEIETITSQLVDFFQGSYFDQLGSAGCPDRAPIFIVGMRRSGASLVERIIHSHSRVERTGELPALENLAQSLNQGPARGECYPDSLAQLEPSALYELGEQYIAMAKPHRREGTPHFTDRRLDNFALVGFIRSILPNAKIIDVRRHPMDTCVANLKQLYPRGQAFSYDQTEIGEYYLQYNRIMDHWDKVLPGKVLRVQYEDLLDDYEPQVLRLLDYLELPWEDNCMNFHETLRTVTNTGTQGIPVRKRVGKVGLWRHYKQGLGELQEALAPIIAEQREAR